MSLHSGRSAGSRLRPHVCGLMVLATLFSLSISGNLLAETKTAIRTASKTVVPTDGMAAADAKDPKLGQDWVRLDYDAKGEVQGMQTAVVRYTSKETAGNESPVQVDLIGAVHIADPAYYEKLNERFKHYDVLLYELVAPEGTIVEKGRG